ncbi:MAG TPA: helix-turn-helix domain-containing protein [Mycobacterium sp.]|nr:helix-turn-helix domain-containing protein [Mycobacterium sp.]
MSTPSRFRRSPDADLRSPGPSPVTTGDHKHSVVRLRANRQAAGVATALAERSDELVDVLGQAVAREAVICEPSAFLPHDAPGKVRAANNIRSVLSAMAPGADFDPAPARQAGIDRAYQQIPLASVNEFYRIAFRRLWDAVADEAASNPKIDRAALHGLTVELHALEHLFMTVLVAGYRDEQNRQPLGDTSRRALLIDALLDGQILDQWSLWEVANRLRLPNKGPFVVVAADVPTMGSAALPEIESKLRSLDVYSAWRLLPDLQVGIVHIKSDHQLDKVLALVTRVAAEQVGVSAPFDDLRDAPHSLHFAKVTLRGHTDPRSKVGVFDGTILATAAVSAPAVMVKAASTELDAFDGLAAEEREILFRTFRVWQENDASIQATADLLICHPNTVRHRLRRIEQRTGRSLSRPRDVAELCLAFEVQRRLM